MPAEASRWSSSTSSAASSPNSPMCRTGATMKWPDEYGYLFRSAIAFSPRCTTSRSSSSPATAMQKTHPGSSSADLMYSRRHGAHSCFTRPSLERLICGLDRNGLRLDPGPQRGEEHHRPDHGQDHDQRGGDEDRLKSEHVGSGTGHSRLRLRGPDSCYGLRDQRRSREATLAAGCEAGRDLALAADQRGGESGRVALDLGWPADRELRSEWAAELSSEHTVERGVEIERLLLAAAGEAPVQAPERRPLPGLEHVLLDRGESSRVRSEHRVVAPRGLRKTEPHLVEVHEGLREGLPRVLQIMVGLVAGEGHARRRLLADPFVGRPALRAEGDCGPGIVVPVVCDVVAVLMRHDLFDGAPGGVFADRDDLAARREVAAVRLLGVTENADLGRRSAVDLDGGDFAAVHKAVDEVGRGLVHRRVDGVFARRLDRDVRAALRGVDAAPSAWGHREESQRPVDDP